MNVRHYKKTTVNYNIKVLEQVKLMSISIAFLVFAFSKFFPLYTRSNFSSSQPTE